MKLKSRLTFLVVIIMLALAMNGCSMQKLVVRSTGGILDGAFEALMMEGDLPLAQTAIESDLKLLEGLLQADPENKKLLLLAAQGFTSYALGFVEDQDTVRATALYLRASDYANRWVELTTGIDLLAIQSMDEFEATAKDLPDKAVPGVFWLANSWGSAIMLNIDDVSLVADLPNVEKLMAYVLDRDEAFYFAGAHLFYCGYYGALPRMFGGDLGKAKAHIDRQRELTGDGFLLADLFEVKFVALKQFDEERARELLTRICEYDVNQQPAIRLMNRVAQEKARWLEENLDLFL